MNRIIKWFRENILREKKKIIKKKRSVRRKGAVRRRRIPQINNFVIVIGAMKSGTTTLFQYLGQHPQIARSHRKETDFFRSPTRWKRGKGAYLRLWYKFDAKKHLYGLEGSPNYTKAPQVAHVARRINRFGTRHGRGFRFIYILRNPIDRIESNIAHNLAMNQAEPGIGMDDKMFRYAINVSRYAFQLDTFLVGFPDAKILLLDFDELCRDPLATMARCTAFLEVDETFEFPLLEPANTRKSANDANKYRLSDANRAELAEILREDALRLRDHYGFDISAWNIT